MEFYSGVRGKIIAHDETVSPAAQSALYGDFAVKYKGSEYRNGFGFAGMEVKFSVEGKTLTVRDVVV